MRFGPISPDLNAWVTNEAEDRLRAAAESMVKNRRDLRGGPYSSWRPLNAALWKKKATPARDIKSIARQASDRSPDRGGDISPRFGASMRCFASGPLKKKIANSLKSPIRDYWAASRPRRILPPPSVDIRGDIFASPRHDFGGWWGVGWWVGGGGGVSSHRARTLSPPRKRLGVRKR